MFICVTATLHQIQSSHKISSASTVKCCTHINASVLCVCVFVCVQVNGVDLRGASHEEAIAALRQTPARVRLTVLRDEAQYRDEENLDVFKVELQKKSGRGLGLSIVGKRSALKHNSHINSTSQADEYRITWWCVCVCVRSGSGVFISEVVRGGAAELDGRLMQGDQILSVNGDDTRHASQETVAAILKVHTHTHTLGQSTEQNLIHMRINSQS